MKIHKSQWQLDTEKRLDDIEQEATWRDCLIKEVAGEIDELHSKLDFLKTLAILNEKKLNQILRLLDPENPMHKKIEGETVLLFPLVD